MKLKKTITTFHIFCIAAGVMISSGIFILPGAAFLRTGPSLFLSYFLAGTAALLGVFSIIELSTAMPRPGGDYYFITRSFGPLPGLIMGLFSWLSLSFKTAFAIFGISEILYTATGIPLFPTAVVCTILFIILNSVGVDLAARFEAVIVLLLLAIMGGYIAGGLPAVEISRLTPFAPHGGHAVLFTAGFVFVSFGGLLNVASLSGEVKNPGRALPLGMISSIVAVTLIYTLLLFVLAGTLPADELKASLTPVADSARTFLGSPGYYAILAAALLAFVSTANAGIMSASRYPAALSRDNLLPSLFAAVSPRYGTPITAIILTGIVVIVSQLLPLELLVKISSSIIITSYILTNLAVIILRESGIQNYRPLFRTPLYPWIQILSMTLFTLLLAEVGLAALETVAVIFTAAVLIYLFYGRKGYNREYALLYLIERIVNRRLTSADLEEELKEVIHQRDDLVIDRVHRILSTSTVRDPAGPLTAQELFAVAAQELSTSLKETPDEVHSLLSEREEESSTALTDFVAIPHIICQEGQDFALCLIRCREGVHFNETHPAVRAVFVLAGAKSERNLHLQMLSAIAQIVQNPDFQQKWSGAKTSQHLRDICLLSSRQRGKAHGVHEKNENQ
ncbi:MAG: amino acid permease [Fibrobacterota bacterium]